MSLRYLTVLRCPQCGYANLLPGLRGIGTHIYFQSDKPCINCLEKTFTFYSGPYDGYYRQVICWSCDADTNRSLEEICVDCGKVLDGADAMVWTKLGWKGEENHMALLPVDIEGELRYLKGFNERLLARYRVCEVCGKLCKNGGGLASHVRRCRGEKKEEFVKKAREMGTKFMWRFSSG